MLYLSGIIISFFLAVVLLSKNHKSTADYILLAWLIILGAHLLAFYFVFTHRQLDYPILSALGMSLPLVHGPFLYLYTRHQTSRQTFKPSELLHFLPLFLSYLMYTKFFLLSHDEQVEVFRQEGKGYEIQSAIRVNAIYISGIVYVTISLIRLLRYRKNMVEQFSNTEKINFNWLLFLIIWMVMIWGVVLVAQDDNLIYGAASLFVLWIGYFGIKQVQVFTHRPVSPAQPFTEKTAPVTLEPVLYPEKDIAYPSKYQKSTLSEEEATAIQAQLNKLMVEQKPYRDPELTLDDLAEKLQIHPNYLSQVINSRENKTFYDLVNEKRVDAFINSIRQPESQQYTMLAIALDCGFNSKASFNRNFKKYTGKTPSEYVRHETEAVA